ncbi:MAG: precorrin-6A reductase [Bacillota bacterium]|nr:precorrin-6A reductase [Bacillota bacterium]
MIRVLLVAGTADAVELADKAPLHWQITATTISQLGARSLTEKKAVDVRIGPLDKKGFAKLIKETAPRYVIDMSHPFATEASANIAAAAADNSLTYLRYLRPSQKLEGEVKRYPDFPCVVEALKEIKGNLFLTTGTKDLHFFQELPDFNSRCYMRVLADSKILAQLEAMSIDPSHIFAMKGVASKELNIALAKEVQARAIVTKDSGVKGGIMEKAAAAAELGIPLLVINRPQENNESFSSIDEIIAYIEGRN